MSDDLNGTSTLALQFSSRQHYTPSFQLAKQLKIPSLVLSRVTSSMTVSCLRMKKSWNLGLEMKFESKQLKVLGYTRKGGRGWEFSTDGKNLISAFQVCAHLLSD